MTGSYNKVKDSIFVAIDIYSVNMFIFSNICIEQRFNAGQRAAVSTRAKFKYNYFIK